MVRFITCVFICFSLCCMAQAQELNARLTINTQKLSTPNKELFSSLETNINQLLNEQKWTDLTYSKNERIDCSVAIIVNEITDQNSFSAEIQVASRRPVYNSSYITSLLNFRDTQFAFSYIQGQSLYYNSMNIDNNIVAVIAFYAYVIIGLDADSFSPNGGRPYFAKAMEIANMAQSLNTKGWEPFSGKNSNRYDLAMGLTEESSASFHTFWYNYHRMGLDEMAANPSRGRIRVIESLSDLQKLHEARPSSIVTAVVGETKVDELMKICAQATDEEKNSVKKLLSQIFPTKNYIINQLK